MVNQPAASAAVNTLAETVARLSEQVAALTTTLNQQRERREEEALPVRRHEAFPARRYEGVPRREERRQAGRQQLGVHRALTRRMDSKSEDEPEMVEEDDVEDRYNHHDYRVKADIPLFFGAMGIEEFLDWQSEVDRFFDVMKVPESKQVKMVAIRLKSVAAIWWDKITTQRRIQRKEPVKTWRHMKKLMLERFAPGIHHTHLVKNNVAEVTVTKEKSDPQVDMELSNTVGQEAVGQEEITFNLPTCEEMPLYADIEQEDGSSFLLPAQGKMQCFDGLDQIRNIDDEKTYVGDFKNATTCSEVEVVGKTVETTLYFMEHNTRVEVTRIDEQPLDMVFPNLDVKSCNKVTSADIMLTRLKSPKEYEDIEEVAKYRNNEALSFEANLKSSSYEVKKNVVKRLQFDPGGQSTVEMTVKMCNGMTKQSYKQEDKITILLHTFKDDMHLKSYFHKRTRGRVPHKWESLMQELLLANGLGPKTISQYPTSPLLY